MEPREAAVASGDSINGLGSHFMIDLNTYVRGAELGYEGVDFYVAGRGGVLGDVPADAVVDAFVHFEPTSISDAWERTASHPRLTSAQEFADVCHDWADAKIPDDVDCARIAELAGKLADHAATVIDPAVAPLFFGWRALPEPGADRPKALAQFRLAADAAPDDPAPWVKLAAMQSEEDEDLAVATALCDRMTVLSYGVKIAEGTPQEVQSNPVVIDAYLGEAEEAG